MKDRTNKSVYSLFAVLLYIAVYVGLGFLLTLAIWPAEAGSDILYWVTKSVICLFVLLYAVLILFGKKDSGVGAIQIMFTLMVSGLPIICRAFYAIPVAGMYIAIVLAVLGFALYLMTMIGLGFYANDISNNSDNK